MQTPGERTIIEYMVRRYRRGRVLAAAILAGCGLSAAAPVAQQPAKPPVPQTDLPTAASLVARHVEAIGGAAAFKTLNSYRAIATLEIPAQQISGQVEMLAQRSNKGLVRAIIPGLGVNEEGFDGKVGWSIDSTGGPAIVSGKELAQRADHAWFDATLHGSDYVRQMTVVGRETFDRRPAFKVRVVKVSGFESTEFFDEESGLLIGEEDTQLSAMGSMPVTSIYREYKTVGRVKLPSVMIQRALGMEQVITIKEFEINKVAASAFDLPPAIKALIKSK